jgi:hypothetical protein
LPTPLPHAMCKAQSTQTIIPQSMDSGLLADAISML